MDVITLTHLEAEEIGAALVDAGKRGQVVCVAVDAEGFKAALGHRGTWSPAFGRRPPGVQAPARTSEIVGALRGAADAVADGVPVRAVAARLVRAYPWLTQEDAVHILRGAQPQPRPRENVAIVLGDPRENIAAELGELILSLAQVEEDQACEDRD